VKQLNKQQIKQYLLDNPRYIENVLENIGCHDIKIIKNKRVQCALPDGDNKTSVQIKLNNTLNSIIHTRNSFSKYTVKDVFTVIQFIKNYTLNESINLVCKICNIQYNNYRNSNNKSNAYDFLKHYIRSIKKEEIIIEDDILPESFIERFVREECLQYTVDGVTKETQEKFQVCYDVLDNRIVFPIRNDEGQLLSFKGRTCCSDYEEKDIPKFISYYPCNNNNYLYGLYENSVRINNSNELYIYEAEKSVMIMDSMGINNVVAVNKKTITDIQLKKILKLGKAIVLMFDNDVSLEEIFVECRKFKGLLDIYYIKDTLNLLGKKDSPCDKGIDVFNRLINECKFKYKGE
jgi:DNA primase